MKISRMTISSDDKTLQCPLFDSSSVSEKTSIICSTNGSPNLHAINIQKTRRTEKNKINASLNSHLEDCVPR